MIIVANGISFSSEMHAHKEQLKRAVQFGAGLSGSGVSCAS
ncbi:hypothetical protein [Mesorhizobium sp. M1005]